MTFSHYRQCALNTLKAQKELETTAISVKVIKHAKESTGTWLPDTKQKLIHFMMGASFVYNVTGYTTHSLTDNLPDFLSTNINNTHCLSFNNVWSVLNFYKVNMYKPRIVKKRITY